MSYPFPGPPPSYEPDPRATGRNALLAAAIGALFGGGRGAAAAGGGFLQGAGQADQMAENRSDARFRQWYQQRQVARQESEAAALEAHRQAQLEIDRQREARTAHEAQLRPQLDNLDRNETEWNRVATAPPGAYPDEFRQKAPAAIAAIRAERARLTGQQPGGFQSPGEAVQGLQMPSMTPAEIAAGQRADRAAAYQKERDVVTDQRESAKEAYQKQRDQVADEFKRQGIKFDERKFVADEKYRADSLAILRGDKAMAQHFRERELGMAGERLKMEQGRETRTAAKDAREAARAAGKDKSRQVIGGELEGHQRRLGQLDKELAAANDAFVSAATAAKADPSNQQLLKARGDAMKRVGQIEAEKTKVKRRYDYLLKIGGGR